MLNRFRLWLRAIVFHRRLEREMQEEMAGHVARSVERWVAGGLTPEAARRAARDEFGPLVSIQEAARDARGTAGLESIIGDLRFGVRQCLRTPLAALTIILIFALGIGFNIGLFVFVDSLVNSPLPGVSSDNSLVRIRGIDRTRPGAAIGREFSLAEYQEYAAQRRLFSAVAAWTSSDAVLGVRSPGTGPSANTLQSGAASYVTDNYFQVLDVRPIVGGGLPTAFDGRETPALVAVISYVVWDRYFERSPDALGRTMTVNDVPVTVVGVAPRRFNGARTGGSQMRVWLPLSARPVVQRAAASDRDEAMFGLVARLAPETAVSHTLPTVQTIAARAHSYTAQRPAPHTLTADVVTLTADNYFPPSGESSGGPERFMSLLIPVIILLITCTNASALLTGLGLARRHEIAVRLALGAPRRRIVRQLVTESVLLALTAAALAAGVIAILLRIFEASIPDIQPVLTWRVTTFSFGLALLTGILFGTSPAVHATRVGVSDVLKDAGAVVARRSRLQAGLVVAQIALTQPALLAMGTLILEMVADYREIPSSLFADRIMEVRFNTNPRYGSMDQNREAALRTLQARLAALPGVVGVTPQGTHHLDVLARDDVFEIAVHPADRAAGVGESGVLNNTLPLRVHVAPPGYFPLRGIPVVRGRDFDSAGRDEAGTVIIGAELARQLWGTADPIGRRFTSTGLHSRRAGTFSVTGVVDEARSGLRSGPTDDYRIFVPDVQITGHFLLRTEGPAQPMIPTVRAVANSEAPVVPVIGVTTLDAIEASQRRSVLRTIAAIVGAGALALSLSAIGLYATVAFAVGQRAREIGARAALGATRTQIVWAFLSRGLRLSLIGLIIGLTLSIVVTRLITAVQGQEAPAGLLALAAVVAFVELGVALVATWIAARRAALVDPLEALRMG